MGKRVAVKSKIGLTHVKIEASTYEEMECIDLEIGGSTIHLNVHPHVDRDDTFSLDIFPSTIYDSVTVFDTLIKDGLNMQRKFHDSPETGRFQVVKVQENSCLTEVA
jgi:hypothetical protein